MDPLLRRPETAVKISHHEPVSDTTTEVYPVYNEDLNGRTYLDCYYMRVTFGKGRGGVTEPRITAEFSPQELRDFAVEIIGLVAMGVTE